MSVNYKCPYCGELMGMDIGINSGLGPTWLTCDVTGERIRTGRKEWPEMGVFGRAWNCIL